MSTENITELLYHLVLDAYVKYYTNYGKRPHTEAIALMKSDIDNNTFKEVATYISRVVAAAGLPPLSEKALSVAAPTLYKAIKNLESQGTYLPTR